MLREMKSFRKKGSKILYQITDAAARRDIDVLQADVNALKIAIGSPLVAAEAADMTDEEKIYVYVGSEDGMTNGNWYYYDTVEEEWTSGGEYNETAIETDKTLTASDVAADAKVTGDEVADLKDKASLVILEDELPIITWVQGSINGENGKTTDADNRVRSSDYESYDEFKKITVTCPEGTAFGIRAYSDPSYSYEEFIDSPTGSTEWVTGTFVLTPVVGQYYRYVVKYVDNSDITPESVDLLAFTIIGTRKSQDVIDELKDASHIIKNETPDKWVQGGISVQSGATREADDRIRALGYAGYDGANKVKVTCAENIRVKIFEYSARTGSSVEIYIGPLEGGFVSKFTFTPTTGHGYRYVLKNLDDSDIAPSDLSESDFNITVTYPVSSLVDNDLDEIFSNMFDSDVGNCGILCAKEHHFVDESMPTIEWYILGDPATNNVYYSKDLASKTYLFTFHERIGYWSFGIDKNNNIICCKQSEYLSDVEAHDDSLRVKPIVYLFEEKYRKANEIETEFEINPCGWLSSVGFICLANGDVLIAEYTRPVVETANVWKISGDPSDGSNWSITKTFDLSGSGTGFKHIHCVQQDFYTGVCYFGTGDDDTSSHIFYSLDNGSTWIAGKENDEKHCRILNLIFTEDYVYWSTDTNKEHYHFVMRAARDSNGIIDFNHIEELVDIPRVSGLATYGCAYFPGYEAIVLLERADGNADSSGAPYQSMPIRVYDIETNTLNNAGTLKVVDPTGTNQHVGFRTRFAEWYSRTSQINLAWHLRGTGIGSRGYNQNKIMGNQATTGYATQTVNNAYLTLFKDNGKYRVTIGTHYI